MLMPPPSPSPIPDFVRARGGVRLVIGATPRGSAALTVAEGAGYRVRFPNAGGTCEGVLINTGGGLAGGDRFTVDAAVEEGARAVLTTQAAEKVYRAEAEPTEIAIRLALEAGASLDWLPQEQILFDGARLARTLDVAMAADARLTLVESTVFGRLARGEAVVQGSFRDRWRVRRGGRLIFAEEVRLDGAVAGLLARPALGGGASAVATLLHAAPDAEARLDQLRASLPAEPSSVVECAAGALDGLLIARFLSADPAALRGALVRSLQALRGVALPRSWQC